MQTRIISAFPGTGKSFFFKKYPNVCIDSDSTKFHWIKGCECLDGEDCGTYKNEKDSIKRVNPDFPENYIQHIKENIGKVEYIFVSSHKVVREALLKNCLHFYLIYPHENDKQMYIFRYNQRGNDNDFILKLQQNWESWINECRLFTPAGCTNIRMSYHTLEEELAHLARFERFVIKK